MTMTDKINTNDGTDELPSTFEHILKYTTASNCKVASPHDSVMNSECVYSFHSPYTGSKGIVVNMKTFVGTIDNLALSSKENEEEGEEKRGLFVRIVKERVVKSALINSNENDEKELSQKVTKLGVGIEGGFASENEKFETISTYSIVLLEKSDCSANKIVNEIPYDETTKSLFPSLIALSADSIIHHAGLAVQQDLSVWELDEEPKPVSKYCEHLPFLDNGVKISPDPSQWKCAQSGDTHNIWLNLSDGHIGGGRKNWDGSGGSNGALDHFLESGEKYPLVVKLGTITEDVETADCYSYSKDEDCPVKIPNLAELLENRGIRVAGLQKTVKTTSELEVELNATYAFDAITEAGKDLTPVSGPGMQGLQNLGNSCYINSVVQTLFSGIIPELAERYGDKKNMIERVAPGKATSNLLVQTHKLATALASGEFAMPQSEICQNSSMSMDTTNPKYRLAPRMFKHAIAKDHVDFRTSHQQDAAQFLQFLLESLDRAELKQSSSSVSVPSKLFAFQTTSRLVCSKDSLVKYSDNAAETILSLRVPVPADVSPKTEFSSPEQKRHKSSQEESSDSKDKVPTVTLQSCLSTWATPYTIDDFRWPHLNNSVHTATSQIRFTNFPRYLVIQIQRYQLGADWTPVKLQVNIDVPHEIDLIHLKSSGPEDGENLVPDEIDINNTNTTASEPKIEEDALLQLTSMGFSMNGCKRGLLAVGGSDTEAALNWIFEHSTDPNFDDPIQPNSAKKQEDGGVDDALVISLVDSLGCFTTDQVRAALGECDGAPDRAADWLFSHMDNLDVAVASLKNKESSTTPSNSSTILEDGEGKYSLVGLISHIGKNTGSGHYVCHLKKNEKWVIFNDEKVALSASPPIQHAYLYVFRRMDTIGTPNPNF